MEVDGLPVDANRIVRMQGLEELAAAIKAAFDAVPDMSYNFDVKPFSYQVGDRVILLPDDEDSSYLLLGKVVK